MSDSPYIVDITAENAQAIIVDESFKVPVLIDFWADWCQPCQALMPVLAKLAEEYRGQFILAKVNTEEYQELATQLGIQSLPTVKLFKDGQPIDEFSGALPESEVRAFLDKHISAPETPAGDAAQLAKQHMEQGDPESALAILKDALTLEPDDFNLKIALAQTLAATKQNEEAKMILESLPEEFIDHDKVKHLRNHLEFDSLAENSASEEELKQRIADNKDDKKAIQELATYYAATQQYDEALALLLGLMKKDRGYQDGIAQKTMLKIFELLGTDPLVRQYRNKMLSLIY